MILPRIRRARKQPGTRKTPYARLRIAASQGRRVIVDELGQSQAAVTLLDDVNARPLFGRLVRAMQDKAKIP